MIVRYSLPFSRVVFIISAPQLPAWIRCEIPHKRSAVPEHAKTKETEHARGVGAISHHLIRISLQQGFADSVISLLLKSPEGFK